MIHNAPSLYPNKIQLTPQQLYSHVEQVYNCFRQSELLIEHTEGEEQRKHINAFSNSISISSYGYLRDYVSTVYHEHICKTSSEISEQRLETILAKLKAATTCYKNIRYLIIDAQKAAQVYESRSNTDSSQGSMVELSNDDSSIEESSNEGNYTSSPIGQLGKLNSEKTMQVICDLREVIDLFKDDASAESFNKAKDGLKQLESKELPNTEIVKFCYFQLWLIHKNENEQTLVLDDDYGEKAMMGSYTATHLERRRAIQRAIITLTITELRDSVGAKQKETIETMLGILEGLQVTQKDMPLNQDNLANSLFGHMYHLHCEERKENDALADPALDTEFGKNAFFDFNPANVNPNTKTQAIKALFHDLEKAWKMEGIK